MDFPRALVVFCVFLLAYLSLQLFLFFRIRDYLRSQIPDRSRRTLYSGLVGCFFLLMLFPLAWRSMSASHPYGPDPWLVRGLFAVFAVWGFGSSGSALVLLCYDFFRRLARPRSVRPGPQIGRRNFLRKSVVVAAAAPFVISGHGVLLGRRRFRVEHFDLPVSGLSSSLAQLSIVHLTDIHVGPFMSPEELAAYVEAVNRLKPDLIALTGDFISRGLDEVAPCVEILAGLKARYGIFACMGNHEVLVGVEDEMTRLFTREGVRVLRNDAASIPIHNTTLNILGIDDLRWGDPDLSRAVTIAQRQPGEVGLLLSHRPEVFPEAFREGIDVVLSGHYHGGQVKLGPEPESLSIASLLTPYAEGLFHLSRRDRFSAPGGKDALLFVSRGIGTTGLPIRVNCPPQIAHLTLKKA